MQEICSIAGNEGCTRGGELRGVRLCVRKYLSERLPEFFLKYQITIGSYGEREQ